MTSLEFTIPDIVSNFVASNDLIITSQGYRNDGDPIDVSNIISFAVTGSTRGKVKFTANGTDAHTIHLVLGYSV